MKTYHWTAHQVRIDEIRPDGWVCLTIKDQSKASPLMVWVNPKKTELDFGKAFQASTTN
jgi:hypothetical protein